MKELFRKLRPWILYILVSYLGMYALIKGRLLGYLMDNDALNFDLTNVYDRELAFNTFLLSPITFPFYLLSGGFHWFGKGMWHLFELLF